MTSAVVHALALALLVLATALRSTQLDRSVPAVVFDLVEDVPDQRPDAPVAPPTDPATPAAAEIAPKEDKPPPAQATTAPPTYETPANQPAAPDPAVDVKEEDHAQPVAPLPPVEPDPPPAPAPTSPTVPPMLPVVDLPPPEIPSAGSIRWPTPKPTAPVRRGAPPTPPTVPAPTLAPALPSTPALSPPRDDPAYATQVLAWLRRFEAFPESARRQGRSGHVHIRVRIDRNGRLLEHAILEAAGGNDFIRATERMLRDASPLPPPPPTLGGNVVEFELRVPYRLQ